MVYLNEFDEFTAEWLQNLRFGTVDDRSIKDVAATELARYRQCHFFAGIGGWPYALKLAGWPSWRPVWTGSCPCQPLSCAGQRGGEKDERHLWPEFYRLISQCRPPTIFGEQVESPDGIEWLDGVSLDLEELGYAVGTADLPAACVGSPQKRQRAFWVAHSEEIYQRWREKAGIDFGEVRQARAISSPSAGRSSGVDAVAKCYDAGQQSGARPVCKSEKRHDAWGSSEVIYCRDGMLRRVEPGTLPLVDGVPRRLDKIRGYGNAIVPQVAAMFVRAFLESNLT